MTDTTRIIATNVDLLMSLREGLNSQQKLGKAAGVGGTNIGRVRRGEVSPTADTIAAIAEAFDLQPADLLREDLFDSNGALQPMSVPRRPTKTAPPLPEGARALIARLSTIPLEDDDYKALDAVLSMAERRQRPKPR